MEAYCRQNNYTDREFCASRYCQEEKYNSSLPLISPLFGVKKNVLPRFKTLKSHEARLIACNGDCGSLLSRIIDGCAYSKGTTDGGVTEVTYNTNKIISDAFWLHGYPLRKELVDLMGKKQLQHENTFFHQIYTALNNPSCFIEGAFCQQIIELFKALKQYQHIDILNEIANKSCIQPNWSISQEVEQFNKRQREETQSKLWKEMEIQNAAIAAIAINLNENSSNYHQQMKKIKEMGKQKKILMNQISKLQQNKKPIIDEQEYQKKIERIKQKPQFIEMTAKNMPLSNQEILAVILYCDEDVFSREIRKTQRGETLNSCLWKKLYSHLCCALYKIWYILHEGNKRFFKHYVKQRAKRFDSNLLFRGERNIKMNQMYKDKYPLHTITSFTSNFEIAKGFVLQTGMILTIKDAFQAMYDGKLMAADVSWISKYPGEEEFILLPTVLKNIKFINKDDINIHSPYATCIYDPHQIEMYEATEYESIDLNGLIFSVSQRLKPPSMWLGYKNREGRITKDYIEEKKNSLKAYVILFGGLTTWECRICGVKSRFCEYSGSIIDMTVECPACRSLFFSFDDTNPDSFECYNLECVAKHGKIKHKDLEKVIDEGKDDWQKAYSMGYKCRKCGHRQRKAQFDRYKDPDFLEKEVNEYIAVVEKEFKYQINFRKDKEEIKRMVLFVMNPANNKTLLDDLLAEFFPTIWGWILQAPGVKELIANRKDDILKTVAKTVGLPGWITPILSGKMEKKVDKVYKKEVKPAQKKVEKEVKRTLKKLKKIRF